MFSEVQHSAGVTDVFVNDPEKRARPRALYTRGALNADGIHADDWNANGHMAYYYDDFGNVRRIDNTNPNIHSPSDPEYRVYKYDSMSRLRKAVTGAQVNLYQYDRWGNLLASPAAASPLTNRLTEAAYDALGNMTQWRGYQYEFDELNRMMYLVAAQSERMYIYNADDERIGAVDNRVPPSTPDGPAGRKESWTIRGTGNQVVRVIENNNGTWSWAKDYIYRGASLLASEGPEGTRHFHLDHLGTVRMMTDANRRVVSRHVYAPFGEEISNPDSDSEAMKFAGHERDNVNAAPLGRIGDLDYMHARYYTPTVGRFLSVDPGRDSTPDQPQSWNLYAYVRNNPVNNVDPTGRVMWNQALVALASQRAARRQRETWYDDGTACINKDEHDRREQRAREAADRKRQDDEESRRARERYVRDVQLGLVPAPIVINKPRPEMRAVTKEEKEEREERKREFEELTGSRMNTDEDQEPVHRPGMGTGGEGIESRALAERIEWENWQRAMQPPID
jgi:RHS repeat-associated protein